MKPTHAALLAITGLLALFNSPLRAQDTPNPSLQPEIPLEPAKPVVPVDPAPTPAPPPPRIVEKQRSPRPGEQLTSYIGVLTGDVTRELRGHLNLPEGFGLMVHEVMPDTPASAAGLKDDDILVRFEDQKLINADQLQTLVRSKKGGDVVPLTVISSGIEKQVNVTIAERYMPARGDDRLDRHLPPGFRGSFFNEEARGDVRDTVDRLRKQARDYQERMQESRRENPTWYRERDNSRRRFEERRERERNNARERAQAESSTPRESASITRKDDSGDYSLRKEGDKNIFTAKPKDGQEQNWNVDNATERDSVPENLKEKLRQLEEIRGGKKPTPPPSPEPVKPAESI